MIGLSLWSLPPLSFLFLFAYQNKKKKEKKEKHKEAGRKAKPEHRTRHSLSSLYNR